MQKPVLNAMYSHDISSENIVENIIRLVTHHMLDNNRRAMLHEVKETKMYQGPHNIICLSRILVSCIMCKSLS